MLSVFPFLFVFRFFAPTVLRVAAAGVLFYLAYFYFSHRKEIAQTHFPVVGNVAWFGQFFAAVSAALGFVFLAGFYTQIAALLGIAGFIKYLVYQRFFPALLSLRFPLSFGTMFLFFIICLSLLLTGAGAFAVDLPL